MGPLRRLREPALKLTGLAAAAGLVAAVLGYPADRNGTRAEDSAGTARGVAAPAVQPAVAVRDLLDRRAAALLRHDRDAFLSTVDPGSPGYRRDQAALFDSVSRLPLASWSYAFDPTRSRPLPDIRAAGYDAPTFAPVVVYLSYRLRGFDTRSVSLPTYPTFLRREAGWFLGPDRHPGGAGIRTGHELWDLGGVVAVAGRSSLVLGHRASPLLAELAAVADRAVLVVSAAWGTDWARRVVVVVPDSEAELHRLLPADRDVSSMAAVATAWIDPTGRGSPSGQRILINPRPFSRLSGVGRAVVLTHEITHLATRAATGPGTPAWLVEGFADYVGYLGAGTPVRRAAAELAAEVRAGRLPAALPADDRFAAGPGLAAAYEEAWLACRLIAERAGAGAPARLYRAAGADPRGGAALAGAFARVLGTTPAAFTADWRRYLQAELS